MNQDIDHHDKGFDLPKHNKKIRPLSSKPKEYRNLVIKKSLTNKISEIDSCSPKKSVEIKLTK